jgi:hypothetical protein
MRELVVSLEQQQCAFFVTFDFCEWLQKKELLADKEYRQIQALRDELLEMWKKGYEVAETIESSLQRTKPTGRSAEMIEFAKHDILKIEGDQIWLEIWFPMILPKEKKIGPIDLPKGLAASLQVGWMITCELKKSKSSWRISEIGNIYPSFPYK